MSSIPERTNLFDVCATVGEFVALLVLAERAAVKVQDFRHAAIFRDVRQHMLGLNPADRLSLYPEAKKGLENLSIHYAV